MNEMAFLFVMRENIVTPTGVMISDNDSTQGLIHVG